MSENSKKTITRKPTAAEVALHEAKRHQEMMRTGLLDGPIPVYQNHYIRRSQSFAEQLIAAINPCDEIALGPFRLCNLPSLADQLEKELGRPPTQAELDAAIIRIKESPGYGHR